MFELDLQRSTSKGGWFPLDDDGYIWVLESVNGRMIAKCSYTFITVSGVQKWDGVFYRQSNDLFDTPYTFEDDLDNLCGCVQWAEMFALGGYYL